MPHQKSQDAVLFLRNSDIDTSDKPFSVSIPCDVGQNVPDFPSTSKVDTVGKSKLLPYFVLALVPVMWGTYAPAVKQLYSLADIPPPSVFFNFLTYLASVVVLNIAGIVGGDDNNTAEEIGEEKDRNKAKLTLMGGVELGLYLFVASNIQVLGIQQTTASRAGFLIQLTTIMVPIIESLFEGKKLSCSLWFAIFVALLGILCISLEHPLDFMSSFTLGTVTNLSVVPGDLLICFSAVIYSLHVVRLGAWANRVKTLQLARVKASTELTMSFVVLGIGLLAKNTALTEYLTNLFSHPAAVSISLLLSTCVWNGIFPTAFTMWAQAFGQRSVSPTKANLIYTSQPVFGTIFAYFLLGETLGTHEIIGFGLVALGVGISLGKQE